MSTLVIEKGIKMPHIHQCRKRERVIRKDIWDTVESMEIGDSCLMDWRQVSMARHYAKEMGKRISTIYMKPHHRVWRVE